MRLSVEHVTTYRYDPPVRGVVQSHRLVPTECLNQTVIGDWVVEVSGGIAGAPFKDGAGDMIRGWSLRGPVQEVQVTVRGVVETRDQAGVLRGLREGIPPLAWLGETAPTAPNPALRDLAAAGVGVDGLALAHDLARLVAEAITWTPGCTDAATTAAEALALGHGVCQDHAHALICAARLRDLPARYVSGYLFAEGASGEAAHAWAEVWIEGLGWVGFDPANRCCPDERYIRLGCGMDAEAAAPIRGVARGVAAESMQIAVAVGQRQQ